VNERRILTYTPSERRHTRNKVKENLKAQTRSYIRNIEVRKCMICRSSGFRMPHIWYILAAKIVGAVLHPNIY
jgi:hypothetical protein